MEQLLSRFGLPLDNEKNGDDSMKTIKLSWVAKRLRIVIFPEKLLNKEVCWIACDVRSYHVAQGRTSHQAIRNLIETCSATNAMAETERRKGNRVIRWRCLLSVKDRARMERKAYLILDGIEVPKWSELKRR